MSLENEDNNSVDKASETFHQSQEPSKISYAREFLLSLRELDICKALPSGFDQTLLGEFEDASHGTRDRQRIFGGLPLQGYRRSDYSSSPPTRGESGNYSWGIYGRWDSHSLGRGDKDSDSQSDRDSDSGRQYDSQSRLPSQSSGHDGLLGSGSFPSRAGCVVGMSALRTQANEHCLLNRSNEPYHPPRPYKAVPHSRRNTNDSYNDETFGSTECTSQDRAEEERRRRASFELMRKEQQKALQEKPKLTTDKHKDDSVSEMTPLLDDKKEARRLLEENNDLDACATISVSSNDSAKSSFPATRPLVPPGFTSSTLEKNSSSKSSIHTLLTELIQVGKPEIEESLLHAKVKALQIGTPGNQEEGQSTQEEKSNEWQLPESDLEVGMGSHLYKTSSLLEATATLDNSGIIELNANNMTDHKVLSDSNQDNSTSILEKLFNSTLTMNITGGSVFSKDHDHKRGDTWSPSNVQSSKFAHWFLEEEKKLAGDPSTAGSSDLLSLIGGSSQGAGQVTVAKATPHIPPELSYPSSQHSNGLITSSMPSTTTEQFYDGSKKIAVPTVLTCEDLEQTILLEYSEKGSLLQPPVHDWNVSSAEIEEPKANVNDHASQHLLSLLKKGTGLTPPHLESGSTEKHVSEIGNTGIAIEKPSQAKAANIHNSGKTVTLETLFGMAFMKELHSVEAPVSVHRGSVGSARADVLESHGLSFPIVEDEHFSNRIDETGSNRTGHGSNVLSSNQREHTELDKIDNWLGYVDPQIEVDSLKLQTEELSKHDGFDRAVDIQLPEEESLITVSDPVNPLNSMFVASGNSFKGEFLSSNTPVDTAEKLAAFNAVFKDEHSRVGQEGLPFIRGPYDLMENEASYHNFHGQPSSQFLPPQISRGRPLFNPLDSCPAQINSQMKFMAPHSITHHDGPPNHQLPANMRRPALHHPNPNTGLAGFDIPAHHPMPQQMQMAGNFPPPHLLHEFPRGGPLLSHPSNRVTGFMQEPNPLHGFHFSNRQPNIGGVGMPAPDGNGGGNHPEAFQRLIEMELRANAKGGHPFNHSQGMFGHELDMGFRYR